MRIKLSPSTLNLFLGCPRCFWLHINYNLKQPRGPMPSIAIGLDSVIKKYFNLYRPKGIMPPILQEEIKGKLISHLPSAFFYNHSDGTLLWGKLDECVILEDKFYAPLDFKTRSSAPGEIHPVFQFQMDVYTLLLKKNSLPINNDAFLIYFYPQEGNLHEGFPFKAEVHRLRTDPERAFEVFQKAIKVLKNDIPPSSSECEYCAWFESVGQKINK
jgi:CRISPR/Cas system-associated exonuclease Cas4 (RecB family)